MSPTLIGCTKVMAVIATVATRPLATRAASAPPATSICDSTQPPKMSPLPFMSAGCGTVLMIGSRELSAIYPRWMLLIRRIFTTISARTRSSANPLARPQYHKKKHGQERKEQRQERRPIRAFGRQTRRIGKGQFLHRPRYRGAGGARARAQAPGH